MLRPVVLAGLLSLGIAPASAQTFQLVFCETPVGAGGGQPIRRYLVAGSGGPATRLSDIPGTAVNDPVSLVFNNQYVLFVANRDAHRGNGTIATFDFDPSFGVFTPRATISGNGITDPVQLCFNPVDGELFVVNWQGGVCSRFRFDAQGNAVPNGTLQMPDGSPQLGVAVRAIDQQLFVSSYGFVRRFARGPGGAYSHLGNLTIPGATNIHFMKFRGDELYVCDIATNAVHRFRFDGTGTPVPNGSVPSTSAVDVAFSPDRNEMFVSRHFAGGFERFRHQSATDTWTSTGVVTGPQGGGLATSVHWFSEYGQGCAGTGNLAPTLIGLGVPSPGNTIHLKVQRGQPNALGTIVMSLQPGNVPLAGCTWLQTAVLGNTSLFLLDGAGVFTYPIAMPATLVPLDFYFQAFLLDFGAPNGLFSASNGLRASVQ